MKSWSLRGAGRTVRWARFHGAVLVAAVLSAGPVNSADLMEVYRQALVSDPQFQGARHEREAQGQVLWQAWSRMLPTASGTYSYMDTTQDIISSDNEVFGSGKTDFKTQEYTLNLTQPVLRYEAIVGISQAKSALTRADLGLSIALEELMLRVSDLYLKALAAQDRLEFAQAEEAAVEKHFELASARFEMGLAPSTDLHETKARLDMVRAQRLEAQNLVDDALQALQEVTGSEVEGLARLKPEAVLEAPVPDDIETWTSLAVKENLAVRLQRQSTEIARKEVDLQRAAHYPVVDLVGRFNNQDTNGTLFGGGSEVESLDLQVRMTVPLLEGGVVLSRTKEAASLSRKANEELNRQVRAAVRQARAAYLGVQSSISRVQALEQSVASHELALEARQEGYRSGLYTSLAVLDAEQELYRARQEYAQARYDYLLNRLRLSQAVGGLRVDDLLAANEDFLADR